MPKKNTKNNLSHITTKEGVTLGINLESWDKDMFKELYEYVQLCEKPDNKFKAIKKYSDFDSWYHAYDNEDEVLDSFETLKSATAVLEIDLSLSKAEIKKQLKSFEKPVLDATKIIQGDVYIPMSTTVTPSTLFKYRRTYELNEKQVSYYEIAKELGTLDGKATVEGEKIKVTNEEVIDWKDGNKKSKKDMLKELACEKRCKSLGDDIGRDIREYKQVLKNIENGTFP